MNDKFHKSAEIKKRSVETKIVQMKEAALKEIRDTSVKIAIDSVKKIISTSVDKSKLDFLFEQNLEEAASIILEDRKHLDNNPKPITKNDIVELLMTINFHNTLI